MTTRRTVLAMLGGSAIVLPWGARAQDIKLPKRVAYLTNRLASDGNANLSVVSDELRKRGWSPGRDVVLDGRFAGGNTALFPKYAAELVAGAPDVIMANTTAALTAVRPHAGAIPIVFLQVTDPVAQGIVPNLTHPGGTITGFADLDFATTGRWLQLLKELVPDLTRVLVLYTPRVSPRQWIDAAMSAAPGLGLTASVGALGDMADFETSIGGFAARGKGALLVVPSSVFAAHRKELIAAAAKHALPAIYPQPQYVREGGLMCGGGIDLEGDLRQAASYVDRILRGANPGDLPVQYPTKFTVLINLKTARALNLTIPPSLLARADEVIE